VSILLDIDICCHDPPSSVFVFVHWIMSIHMGRWVNKMMIINGMKNVHISLFFIVSNETRYPWFITLAFCAPTTCVRFQRLHVSVCGCRTVSTSSACIRWKSKLMACLNIFH
jgi:hypothetical protein